jgi:hypothetical protein
MDTGKIDVGRVGVGREEGLGQPCQRKEERDKMERTQRAGE